MSVIGPELQAYVVVWETRDEEGALVYGGARRVLARGAAQAEARAREEIADELQRLPGAVDILRVSALPPG